MNLAAALARSAAVDPGRVAIQADGASLTRGALQQAIERATTTLRVDWAVGPGDRVGYLGANRYEELVMLFALARIGGVFVPLNTRLAVTELAAIVLHAGLHSLATDAGHRDVGTAVIDGAAARTAPGPAPPDRVRPRSIDDLSIDDRSMGTGQAFGDGRPARRQGDRPARTRPDSHTDPAAAVLMAYTSGTTGAPKAAVHTQRALLANAAASIVAHGMTEDDRVLTVLPLFHVGGLCIQTLPALLCGASVVLHPRFDASAWLDAVAYRRPTLSLMVPATLRAVVAHPGWPGANLTCLRLLMTGASIVPRPLIDAVHARGVPVGQIYGSTETGPVTIALTARDAGRKAGHAGWPCFPASVRLVDARGVDVTAGAVGEILVRAPNVMEGYWREPPKAGFCDGWFATGDLARYDDDGCFEVVGRSRDLIISGGENIYPAELEAVLMSIPGVAEAAVVGIPDERWGEVPAAFVVRGIGTATPLDEATVAAAFEQRLARYKQPKRIVFVDRLPRNAMGKVLVPVLQERLLRG